MLQQEALSVSSTADRTEPAPSLRECEVPQPNAGQPYASSSLSVVESTPAPQPQAQPLVFPALSPSALKFLMEYKTAPCVAEQTKGGCPAGKGCPKFHNLAERRRLPIRDNKLVYGTVICPTIAQGGVCPRGETCTFAHSSQEIVYHPAIFQGLQSVAAGGTCGGFAIWTQIFQTPSQVPPTQPEAKTEASDKPNLVPYPPYVAVSYGSVAAAVDSQLLTFKTQPCPYQCQHNHKRCPFFHSAKDRRRRPGGYSAERCESSEGENGNCRGGDNCLRSHSMVEKLYHPDKYKTKYCSNYPQHLADCEYGEFCCFAHSDAELKVDLIHGLESDADFFLYYFKTVWCPYTEEHNKALCVYAHNWQDFRRAPHLFRYSSQVCGNWQSETFISEYREGCVYQENCGYSHGWKEHLYHPHTYKTAPCPDARKCRKGWECPYFHSPIDRRLVNPLFLYIPRPRHFPHNPRVIPTSNLNTLRQIQLRQLSFPAPSVEVLSRVYSAAPPMPQMVMARTISVCPTNQATNGQLTIAAKELPDCPEALTVPREESPEPKAAPIEDEELCQIFSHGANQDNSNFIFFTPSQDSTHDQHCIEHTTATDTNAGAARWSLPHPVQRSSFGKPAIFQHLHIPSRCHSYDSLLSGLCAMASFDL